MREPVHKKDKKEKNVNNEIENETSAATGSFIADRREWIRGFLPTVFQGISFPDLDGFIPVHPEAAGAVGRWVGDIWEGILRPMVLFGVPNCGKTALACCAWNALAPSVQDRANYPDVALCGTADNIAFVRGEDLADTLTRGGTGDSGATRVGYSIEHIKTCYLCVLDDLDKFPCGEWGRALLNLIDARVCQYAYPTIITMNLTPAQLEERYGDYGPAIVSRLTRSGGMFVRVTRRNGETE